MRVDGGKGRGGVGVVDLRFTWWAKVIKGCQGEKL